MDVLEILTKISEIQTKNLINIFGTNPEIQTKKYRNPNKNPGSLNAQKFNQKRV
jgi:hypothetical protein